MNAMGHCLLERIAQVWQNIFVRELTRNGQLNLSGKETEFFAIPEQHSIYGILIIAEGVSSISPIHESVRLALLVFYYVQYSPILANEHSLQRACIFSDQMWKALTRLQGGLLDAWAFSHEMLLWVLVHGAQYFRGQGCRPWYIIDLAKVLTRLTPPVRTLDQLEEVFTRLSYVKRIYGPSIAQIWAEASMIMDDAS